MWTPDRKPRRILVVDGHADAADTLAALLQLHGYEVSAAYTAAAALTAAAAFAPDVVFMSLGLPDLDGCELARRLCGGGHGPRPRVMVALTGYGRTQDETAARTAGFDHFLVKPAEPDAVLATLA